MRLRISLALTVLAMPAAGYAASKVAVCHRGAILDVASRAAPAHIAHGDHLVVAELCNGVDDDCDGWVDEGAVVDPDDPSTATCLAPVDSDAQLLVWERAGRIPNGCSWRQTALRPGDSLPDAPSEREACGQWLTLGSGTYDLGELRFDVPTVLVGTGDTVVHGGVRLLAGAPVRISGIRFVDATYPGAIYAAHPDADLTLVDVSVERARGFGVYQHGGVLRMLRVRISDTRATERPTALPEALLGLRPMTSRVDPGPFELLPVIAGLAFETWGWGEYLESWLKSEVTSPGTGWTPSEAPMNYSCYGSAIFVGPGTTAELGLGSVVGNAGPGLVVLGEHTEATDLGSVYTGNGRVPTSVDAFYATDLSAGCWGGTTVRDGAVFASSANTWHANNLVNLFVAAKGVSLTRTAGLTEAEQWSTDLPADGAMAIDEATSAFKWVDAGGNPRAGFLLRGSTGALEDCRAHGGRFGLVLQSGSTVSYGEDTHFYDNSDQNILSDGQQDVPNEPIDVPQQLH